MCSFFSFSLGHVDWSQTAKSTWLRRSILWHNSSMIYPKNTASHLKLLVWLSMYRYSHLPSLTEFSYAIWKWFRLKRYLDTQQMISFDRNYSVITLSCSLLSLHSNESDTHTHIDSHIVLMGHLDILQFMLFTILTCLTFNPFNQIEPAAIIAYSNEKRMTYIMWRNMWMIHM